jgi:hypothetical protein
MPDITFPFSILFGIFFWGIFLPILWPTWIVCSISVLFGFFGARITFTFVICTIAVNLYILLGISNNEDLNQAFQDRIQFYKIVLRLIMQFLVSNISIGIPALFYSTVCYLIGTKIGKKIRSFNAVQSNQ